MVAKIIDRCIRQMTYSKYNKMVWLFEENATRHILRDFDGGGGLYVFQNSETKMFVYYSFCLFDQLSTFLNFKITANHMPSEDKKTSFVVKYPMADGKWL
jgi:hypothetical protein